MSVVRALAVSSLLVLTVAVSLSGQQQPTAKESAKETQSGTKLSGNLERGRYLVENVIMCYECHSSRDQQGNIMPGTKFKGGPMPMRPSWSSDWPLQIPRIAGLPGYDDAQALRLLTQGAIKWNGTQLRYPMPRFHMSQQDAADIITYLRSL